jgi:hypothetical protein
MTRDLFFLQLNICGHSPFVTSSLTRRWVCLLWICVAWITRIWSVKQTEDSIVAVQWLQTCFIWWVQTLSKNKTRRILLSIISIWQLSQCNNYLGIGRLIFLFRQGHVLLFPTPSPYQHWGPPSLLFYRERRPLHWEQIILNLKCDDQECVDLHLHSSKLPFS